MKIIVLYDHLGATYCVSCVMYIIY